MAVIAQVLAAPRVGLALVHQLPLALALPQRLRLPGLPRPRAVQKYESIWAALLGLHLGTQE